jgi:(p)ppGpp synthase/HD superfamily hydrolase
VWLPFRIRCVREIEVRLYVELGFQHGRLADLIQLLAESGVSITGLKPDRSLYHVGMPERSTEVTFLVTSVRHKHRVLSELSAKGFAIRELIGSRFEQ